MTYNCEKCETELDEDVDAMMILRRPDVDAIAYCLDNVGCAEAGADAATISARRNAAGIKPEKPEAAGAD
jgi:hypothetical protein